MMETPSAWVSMRRQGGVQVGREPRVGQGLEANRSEWSPGGDAQGAISRLDGGAGYAELADDGIHHPHGRVDELDVAARHGRGDGEGARFDAVGHEREGGAVQALDALDGHDLGAGAGDARAHAVQQGGEGLDLGLGGGVDDRGLAPGERGGQEDVLRARDGGVVGEDAGAHQPLGGARLVVLADTVDGGAHRHEPVEVHADRTLADDIAAGGREGGEAVAGEQGTHHLEGGAVLGDELDGRLKCAHARRGDLDAVTFGALDGGAEVDEQAGQGIDVGDGGDVVEDDRLLGEERGAHGGEGGIRGTGDAYGAAEDRAATHLVAGAMAAPWSPYCASVWGQAENLPQ